MANCPKSGGLTALTENKGEAAPREEGSSMGSLQLAAIVKGKQIETGVGMKGRLFAQLRIGQNEIQALVDTGASDNFLKLEEAQKLGITFSGKAGWLKAVNSKPTPTHGVAANVNVRIGEWTGLIDFSVVSMDDYSCVLGMDFMDRVRAIPIPFANSLCIVEDKGACTVPLRRGKSAGGTLSALQLAKGVRKLEPTFLVALQAENNEQSGVVVPHEVHWSGNKSAVTQAVGTSVAEEPTVRGRRKGQAKSREPSRAREEVGDFETRLSRLELYVAGEESRVDGLENRVEGLAEDLEETRGEAQAAHNMALDKIATESEVLRVSQAEEVSALREENRVEGGS
ncbi:hypothetical protein GH714_027337 [Hevea brasiliensis]|uniref:Uncharacterized protein n=1 Tax=Hevea brasiliensis TaxID=3981 RepID=A0A6A6M907_HEVBR|nr:hypothetical protein GH714_027337 [Hevea brasiliensis]